MEEMYIFISNQTLLLLLLPICRDEATTCVRVFPKQLLLCVGWHARNLNEISPEAQPLSNHSTTVPPSFPTTSTMFILPSFYTCTVSDNEYDTFAYLWSKTAILTEVWHNINMHWYHTPGLSQKVYNFDTYISRGSKVTSRQSLKGLIFCHFT